MREKILINIIFINMSNFDHKLLHYYKHTAADVLDVNLDIDNIEFMVNYFTYAHIYVVDKMNYNLISSSVKNNNRIKLYTSVDYSDYNFVKNHLVDKNIKFDIIINKYLTNYDNLVNFVLLYSKLLKDDGLLVIKNIKQKEWAVKLKQDIPDDLKPFVAIYDHVSNVVFTISKFKYGELNLIQIR